MANLDQFIENVARSKLLSSRDLEVARNQILGTSLGAETLPEDQKVVRLARFLIQQRKLTAYQVKKLIRGATKGFFLGDYKILRSIGEGGMGKVFLAVRQRDGTRVAIKVLPPRKAVEGGQALKRFKREMDLSRRVRHPNVARTLDIGHEGDVYFMVLEYVPGESLYQLVKSENGGPLRVPDAARYFIKVLDGLQAAHNAGLVHRDIKPSNLMVTPDGDARILDLGLARATDDDSLPQLTAQHVVIGTLDYASPEQLGNAAKADLRSDLYSLGCTLYFALAGRPPFDGGDVVNKIFKQRMDDPEPLERVVKGVPTAFAAIVRKLMAKSPADRYQNCAEVRADLVRWTDPAVVRSILGVEADTARIFRPPPPTLEEEDLRILDDEFGGPTTSSLRDLGDAQVPSAPMHKPPPPPRPALVIPEGSRGSTRPTTSRADAYRSPSPGEDVLVADSGRAESDDVRWVIRFAALAVMVGVLAILVITLLR